MLANPSTTEFLEQNAVNYTYCQKHDIWAALPNPSSFWILILGTILLNLVYLLKSSTTELCCNTTYTVIHRIDALGTEADTESINLSDFNKSHTMASQVCKLYLYRESFIRINWVLSELWTIKITSPGRIYLGGPGNSMKYDIL